MLLGVLLGVAASALAWSPADVDIAFNSQYAIDDAIVLPDLSYGSGDAWFAPEEYGPFPSGIGFGNYFNSDYAGLNYMVMGVDTEPNGSYGFFVGVPFGEVSSLQGKSFSSLFPDWDESEVISDLLAGVDSQGYWNNYGEDQFMNEYSGYNLGSQFGLFYLMSFSGGTEIGTASFSNPNSSTPAPLAVLPFGLGVLARRRRRDH